MPPTYPGTRRSRCGCQSVSVSVGGCQWVSVSVYADLRRAGWAATGGSSSVAEKRRHTRKTLQRELVCFGCLRVFATVARTLLCACASVCVCVCILRPCECKAGYSPEDTLFCLSLSFVCSLSSSFLSANRVPLHTLDSAVASKTAAPAAGTAGTGLRRWLSLIFLMCLSRGPIRVIKARPPSRKPQKRGGASIGLCLCL